MPDQEATSSESVSRRLESARRRAFVGREEELELFGWALRHAELPFVVLHVHGPGGIGKSSLLEAFSDRASRMGQSVVRLDGREVEPSREGFGRALAAAGVGELPRALLVDAYEALAPIDAWIRSDLAPSLDGRTLLVLAGREPPAAPWREDAGWRELARFVTLRNLAPDDARAFLERRGVAGPRIEEALAFTHGHPLALALVADVLAQEGGAEAGLTQERSLDIIRVLVQRFTGRVPSALHREALQVCAHARATTEPLLASVLGREDVHELFEWLRGLSFIECTPFGLQPHELARDALDADLRWRNPPAYVSVHRRVKAHVAERKLTARGIEFQRAFLDGLFLLRNLPMVRSLYLWKELGRRVAEAATAGDHPSILEIATRHLGPGPAARVSRWLERQPRCAFVYREGVQRISAFTLEVDLVAASEEDLAADPLVRLAWEHMRRTAPLRRGEGAEMSRAFADAEQGRSVPSSAAELVSLVATRAWFSHPGPAWSFTAVEPEVWGEFMELMAFRRVPGELVDDGVRVALFAHDWRALPPPAWLELMRDREIGAGEGDPSPPGAPADPLIVLSQPEFEEAVRQALRDCTSPEALRGSVLLRSRLVLERAAGGPPVVALQALLHEATAALGADPRKEKLHRAVFRTFIQPAPTQERAAELLRLPFGTYRRHLQAGIAAVVAWLWERELHGSTLGSDGA